MFNPEEQSRISELADSFVHPDYSYFTDLRASEISLASSDNRRDIIWFNELAKNPELLFKVRMGIIFELYLRSRLAITDLDHKGLAALNKFTNNNIESVNFEHPCCPGEKFLPAFKNLIDVQIYHKILKEEGFEGILKQIKSNTEAGS